MDRKQGCFITGILCHIYCNILKDIYQFQKCLTIYVVKSLILTLV